MHLDIEKMCPLDGLEATVEFVNTSDHDIVLLAPRGDGTACTWIEAVPEECPLAAPPHFDLRGEEERVTLRPGGHMTSPTLWKNERGILMSVSTNVPWEV